MTRAEPGRRFPVWIAYPLLLLLVFAAWSVSSPPGSSPDEDYHLSSAWCAFGPRPGLCASVAPGSRLVPLDVGTIACYAFKPDVSGRCDQHPGQTVETSRGNFARYYPDGFYSTMGLFAGPSLEQSVLAMRLLNSSIYVVGLAALLLLCRPESRGNLVTASLVTLVPLGLFIVASVNPSSWAITSATLLWASGVEFVRATDRRRKIGLAIIAFVATVMAVSARADAAVVAGLAITLVWFLTVKFGRRALITGGIVAVVVIAAVLWAASLGSVQQLTSLPPLNPTEPRNGWRLRLEALPGFFLGAFGTRGLGWLDTVMPIYTWVPAATAYVLALLWGLRRCGWRKAVALIAVLGGSAGVVYVIATIRLAMPERVLQPRYFLPMLVLAVMIALVDDHDDGVAPRIVEGRPLARRVFLAASVLVGLGLVVAQAAALHTNLKRYLTGLDYPGRNLNNNIEWWWNWAPPPMVVWGIGSVAFLGAVVAVVVIAARRPASPIASLSE